MGQNKGTGSSFASHFPEFRHSDIVKGLLIHRFLFPEPADGQPVYMMFKRRTIIRIRLIL